MSYIGTEPKDIRSFGRTKFDYTATQGQTAFTGADDDGKVLAFTVGQIEVYVNGILMDDSDFTTTGTGTVTLASAANLNDVINIVSFESNIPDNDYVPASGGTFTGNVTAGGTLGVTGDLTVGSSDFFVDVSDDVVGVGTTSPATPIAKFGGSAKGLAVKAGQPTVAVEASANSQYVGYLGQASTNTYLGALGGGSLIMQTGTSGTTRMTIDASGNVLMPYQPSFYAYFTNAIQFSASGSTQKISNFTEYNDTGNCWDQTNQRFTAPVAGKYYFALTGSYTYSSGYFFPKLTTNGGTSAVAGAFHYPMQTSSYIPYTITLLIALSANDYVEMMMDTNYGVTLYNTNFSGFLIG